MDIGSITWPLVLLVGGWYFRKEIKAAFSRIKEVGPAGFKLDSAASTQQAITATTAPKVDFIAGIKQFISPEVLDPAVAQIKTELQAHSLDKDEQLEIMIHGVASLSIQLNHERTYRNIFGSQVNALVMMNAAGGASEEALKQLYEQTAAQYPEIYKSFTFEK